MTTINYRRIVRDSNGDEFAELHAPEGHWLRWHTPNGDVRCVCAECAPEVQVAGNVEMEALPVTATGDELADEVTVSCSICGEPPEGKSR